MIDESDNRRNSVLALVNATFANNGAISHHGKIAVNARISEEDRAFLNKCTLPTEELLTWDFDPNTYGCRTVAAVCNNLGKLGFEHDTRVVLAGDHRVLLCVIDGETDR